MIAGICGICGRMGAMILRKVLERGHVLGAGFDSESSPLFGKDASMVINSAALGVPVTAISAERIMTVDGILDFSSPRASLILMDLAKKHRKPMVIGTTGFSDDQKKSISGAAAEIPILFSPNMSVGVNLLFKLTEMASRALDRSFDIEVFESHHRFKKDAPSGTAKRLVEIIKSTEGNSDLREVPGRDGIMGERRCDEIGVFAMRGGDIVGEHTVFYVGMGERIELTHRATSRDTFATGAVMGLEFLKDKKPGLYSMFDVLGI